MLSPVRRLRLTSSVLSVGTGTVALLGGRFLVLLLAATRLDPQAFGSLAVAQSLVVFVERLFNVQSWQFIVRRGSEALSNGDRSDLHSVLGASMLADVMGGTAAFATSVLLIGFANSWIGIEPSATRIAQTYCLIAFFNAHGAWAGLLRLFERFGAYAAYQAMAGVGVLAAVSFVLVWVPAADSGAVLAAWLLVELCAFVFLVVVAVSTAKRNGIDFGIVLRSGEQAFKQFRRSMPFFASVNAASSLRMVTKEGDVLLVSALLGPVLAGAYKLGRNLAMLPVLFTDMLYYVAYPVFSKLSVAGENGALNALVKRALIFGSAIGVASILVVLSAGDDLLQFLSLQSGQTPQVLRTYIFAAAIAAATFPFAPVLLATGDQGYQLKSLALATALYLLAAVPLTIVYATTGAALAAVLFISAWSLLVARRLRTRGIL